jgi:hypothetical protein
MATTTQQRTKSNSRKPAESSEWTGRSLADLREWRINFAGYLATGYSRLGEPLSAADRATITRLVAKETRTLAAIDAELAARGA